MKLIKNVSSCTGGGGSPLSRISEDFPNYSALPKNVVLGKLRAGALRAAAPYRKFGFTMAEILLSLTIIGVVAVITLPSLTGNINERTWNTQRKALYARISQAIALMPSLNGFGTLTEDADGNVTEDTAAETLITQGLAKVLKINNICDSEHLADCGIVDKFINYKGNKFNTPKTLLTLQPRIIVSNYFGHSYSIPDSKAVAFETANGESIIAYYNRVCYDNYNDRAIMFAPKVCVNFIFDLNGKKGPNTFGKDVGIIGIVNPTDSRVAMPRLVGESGNPGSNLTAGCVAKYGQQSRAITFEELMIVWLNPSAYAITCRGTGVLHNGKYHYVDTCGGYMHSNNTSSMDHAYCVERN